MVKSVSTVLHKSIGPRQMVRKAKEKGKKEEEEESQRGRLEKIVLSCQCSTVPAQQV